MLIWMDLENLAPHWIQTLECPARGSCYADYTIPTTTKPGNNTPDMYIYICWTSHCVIIMLPLCGRNVHRRNLI
jgi:hypothetical protein